MRYERFELYAIGISAVIVLAVTVTAARASSNALTEVIAGLLLLIVLSSAVHFGRRGGFVAAIAASVVYVLISVPQATAEGGLTARSLLVLFLRVATFGLIGIVGGEACGRLRHVLSRFADAETFDEWSHVFNQRHASRTLDRAMASLERYGEQFTVVMLTLSPAVTADLTPQRIRTIVRSVGAYLRSDLRMVDEVSRLDDGQFFMLLPHTPAEGGRVVAARVAKGVAELIGAREESVTARAMNPNEDAPALTGLADSIRPTAGDDGYSEASGAYSSPGASARKPAADSTSSAPGPSTLNMSTAASPEGSTKQ